MALVRRKAEAELHVSTGRRARGLRASCGELTEMDPVPGEMTRELLEGGAVGTVSPERRHWTRPEPRVHGTVPPTPSRRAP